MRVPAPDQIARHKHFLRLHYRETVGEMPLRHRRSAALAAARNVGRLSAFRQARVVGLFLSLPWEIDSGPLIALSHGAGKSVAVPVVFPEEERMRFALLEPGQTAFKINVYGIREPARRVWAETLDLVIVPGSAFTKTGDRLGAGAGYYDRFLAQRSPPLCVGVCFDEQTAVRLPRAPHDRRMDAVVTPRHIFRFNRV